MPELFVPKSIVDDIISVMEDLSSHPEMLDIQDARQHPELSSSQILTVMIDEGTHVQFVFSPHPTQGIRISSISCGMYTDIDAATDSEVFPEVRFEIHQNSVHSLAWSFDTPVDEVVTHERMKKLLHIVQTMKERMSDLLADETLM